MEAEEAQHTKAEDAHWSYSGETGPHAWSGLEADYIPCSSGSEQSPVNIAETVSGDAELVINYDAVPLQVLNIGHSIQINTKPGNSIVFNGQTYELVQVHSHTPSEHTINGQPAAMEWHFVHKDNAGHLVVLGVLMNVGAANPGMAVFWDRLPQEEGTVASSQSYLSLESMLPADRSFYMYDGSLTTPPCSQEVEWIVMKTPLTASQQQIDVHRAMFGETARPVQNLYGRTVTEVHKPADTVTQ